MKPLIEAKKSDEKKQVLEQEPAKQIGREIEDDVILDYQRSKVGAALPWDHPRHAVRAPWADLSNDVGPRDSSRGIRSGM